MDMDEVRVALLASSGFAIIFLVEGLFHGVLLRDIYQYTGVAWRSPIVMTNYFPYALLSQLVMAVAAALLFEAGFTQANYHQGFKFGFYIGTIVVAHQLMIFAYLVIPFSIIVTWILISYVECMMMGVVFVWLTRRGEREKEMKEKKIEE